MTRLILAAALVLWGNGAGAQTATGCLKYPGVGICPESLAPCFANRLPARQCTVSEVKEPTVAWQFPEDEEEETKQTASHHVPRLADNFDSSWLPSRLTGEWQAVETYGCPGDVRCPLPPSNLDHALQICERHRHTEFPDWWGGNRPPAATLVYDDDFAALCTTLQHRRDAADLDEVKRAAGEKE